MDRKSVEQRLSEILNTNHNPGSKKLLVEVVGNNSLLVENHQGIALYNAEKVVVKSKDGLVEIEGCMLKIKKISNEQLWVRGCVHCVKFIEKDGLIE